MGITIQNPPLKNPDPDPEEAELNGKQMSFLEHLEELRVRLLHSIYSIIVTTGVCFYFRNQIYAYLAKPLTDTLTRAAPAGAACLHQSLSILSTFTSNSPSWAGFFLLRPTFCFSFGCSSRPDFTATRRNTSGPLSCSPPACSCPGGFFAYKLALPKAFRFLLEFAWQFQPMVTINEYWDLAISIIVAVGLVFELARGDFAAFRFWHCHSQIPHQELSLCRVADGGRRRRRCPHQ